MTRIKLNQINKKIQEFNEKKKKMYIYTLKYKND